jgi:hypothetical protein
LQVQAVRFPNLCYFFSQLSDALFDGLLHQDRLAEHAARITVVKSPFHRQPGCGCKPNLAVSAMFNVLTASSVRCKTLVAYGSEGPKPRPHFPTQAPV